jgi:hypothetical protein
MCGEGIKSRIKVGPKTIVIGSVPDIAYRRGRSLKYSQFAA